jgi:hypothetical protein
MCFAHFQEAVIAKKYVPLFATMLLTTSLVPDFSWYLHVLTTSSTALGTGATLENLGGTFLRCWGPFCSNEHRQCTASKASGSLTGKSESGWLTPCI